MKLGKVLLQTGQVEALKQLGHGQIRNRELLVMAKADDRFLLTFRSHQEHLPSRARECS